MNRFLTMVAAVAPLATASAQTPPAAAPAAPAAQGSIFDKAVNKPGLGWSLYGANQSARQVTAPADVPGAAAVRVAVTRPGAHPWDVGAAYPTVKPIASGDTMFLIVYLRAPDAKEGGGIAVPIGAGEADAPYAPISAETVQVGPTWKRFYAAGVAPKAFAAGKARISLQLGGGKQVVEVGPAYLLDLGAKFDQSKLPRN